MKFRLLFLILILFSSCGNYYFLSSPPKNLTANNLNINQLDFKASNDTVVVYTLYRKYSPTGNYNILFDYKPFLFTKHGRYNALLETNEMNVIGKIRRVSPSEEIIWFKDYFLFNGLKYNYAYSSSGQVILEKDRKIVADYNLKQKLKVQVKGDYIFVGQDNNKAYYETNFPMQQIDKSTINRAHSLVEIENGKVGYTENEKESNILLYKNKNLEIKLNENKIQCKSNTVKTFQFPEYNKPFEALNNSYISGDTVFFCYNKSIIYKYTSDGLTELINLKSFDTKAEVLAFRIVNDKVYYINEENYNGKLELNGNNLPINKTRSNVV